MKNKFDYYTKNSKKVVPNTLFFSENDLHLAEAIENGATTIISNNKLELEVPCYQRDVLKEYSRILKEVYPHDQKLIGITGTDGKTTTCAIISHLLGNDNCANIGTNGIFYKNKTIDTGLTTPMLEEIYRSFVTFAENDIQYTAMEVSSEGILNNRVAGLNFDIAIFTNLSNEHLNSHKTMANYLATKLKLFEQLSPTGTAIINIDDKYLRDISRPKNTITFGKSVPADYIIMDIEFDSETMTFSVITKEKEYFISTNLIGEYNAYNITSALIVGELLQVDNILDKLKTIPKIEGRFVKIAGPVEVIVDFAHTPNALKNLLTTVREICNKNIVLVVGAAGRKDREKRKDMGLISTEYSDFVIFTSEDPKDEDENEIISDLLTDVKTDNHLTVLDRKKAIRTAISIARDGDVVVVSGKGNEQFFYKDNEKFKHNDISTVKEALNIDLV